MIEKRKYSTNELVRILEEFGNKPVPLFHMEAEAIISRLRAMDKLVKAIDLTLEDWGSRLSSDAEECLINVIAECKGKQ